MVVKIEEDKEYWERKPVHTKRLRKKVQFITPRQFKVNKIKKKKNEELKY